jgi:hypothetical protein
MALKDWRTKLNEKKEKIYVNEETGQTITISDISGKPFMRGTWYVRVLDYDGIKINGFEGNKLQTLRFAKAYMKKDGKLKKVI